MDLAAFEKWLHAVANRLLGPAHDLHDDLVNEGAFAMWRGAESREFEFEGQRVSYAIKCAESRMKDVAWGNGQPLGHEPMHGSKPAKEVQILDNADLDETFREKITASALDVAELACLAYHHGQIWRALDGLSSAQRAAAVAIMRDDAMTKAQHNQWYKARERLAVELAHLR